MHRNYDKIIFTFTQINSPIIELCDWRVGDNLASVSVEVGLCCMQCTKFQSFRLDEMIVFLLSITINIK